MRSARLLFRRQDHLRYHRIDGKHGHLPPGYRQVAVAVQGAQGEQMLQRLDEALRRRRIHELELQEIPDSQAKQQEYNVPQICPLYLRNRVLFQFQLVGLRRVQPEGFSRSHATGPAGPLVGRCLRYWCDHEGRRAGSWIVTVQLAKSRIDNVYNTVDCQRSFRDICCQDNLNKKRYKRNTTRVKL